MHTEPTIEELKSMIEDLKRQLALALDAAVGRDKPENDAACYPSFDEWWNDQENGCPTLVLDNDEQFARAVWNAAIKST